MSMIENKIEAALSRLKKILPLQASLAKLKKDDVMLYHGILNNFAWQGRPPDDRELAIITPLFAETLQVLASRGFITLDANNQLSGAYPFSTQQRGYRVRIHNQEVNGMCALDALAPSAMYACQSKVYSTCAVSQQPIYIELENQYIVNKEHCREIFLGINWGAVSDTVCCADSLCTEMIFMKGDAIAKQWFSEDPRQREIFTLDEANELSSEFFLPLMNHTF